MSEEAELVTVIHCVVSCMVGVSECLAACVGDVSGTVWSCPDVGVVDLATASDVECISSDSED